MLAKGPQPCVVFAVPYGVAAVLMIQRRRVPRAACSQCEVPKTLAGKPSAAPGRGSRAEWKWTLGGAAAAAALFIAITVPWPLAVVRLVPGAYEIWKAQSFDRSMGDLGHERPMYFYLARLPILVAPWGIFFGIGAVLAVVRILRRPAERPWLIMAAAWLVGPLVGFSVAVGKSDYYILPLLSAAAIFTALAVEWCLAPSEPRAERAGRLILLGHGAAVVLGGIAGVVFYLLFRYDVAALEKIRGLEPYLRPPVFNAVLVIGLVAIVGGAAAIVFAILRRAAWGLAALALMFAVTYLVSWPTLQGPLDRGVTAAQFGRQIRSVSGGLPVVAYVEANHTTIFYAQRAIPEVRTHDELAAKIAATIAAGRSILVTCDEKHRAELSDLPTAISITHQPDMWRPDEGFWLMEFGPPREKPIKH
jgi:4-amino-4-deoxy-L-arabinose transferase-like glycosyltransferase